jgi:antitoxin component YwqK of YwqJK toxin-antitoxin module
MLDLTIYAQLTKLNTLISGKQFTYVEYYSSGQLKVLGSYKDTSKTSDWIYFNLKGEVLAYGRYKNNRKFGAWSYRTSMWSRKIKWKAAYVPDESFEYDQEGNLVLIDEASEESCRHTYKNGFLTKTTRI